MTFLSYCVGHSKIASDIMDKLMFSKLSKSSPDDFKRTLSDLKTQVEEWRQSLPEFVRHSKRSTECELPATWNGHLAEYLRCGYHTLVLGIHSVLAYPWTIKALFPNISGALDEQIEESARIVAETSRDIVLNSNSMDISPSTPTWYATSIPLLETFLAHCFLAKSSGFLQQPPSTYSYTWSRTQMHRLR
jgi:hypothetical protein